jgi:hypothetical protein
MQKSNESVTLAFIQELPTLAIGTIVIIVLSVLMLMHIMLVSDALPIFYIIVSYFLANGSARLVANKSMQAVTQANGTVP